MKKSILVLFVLSLALFAFAEENNYKHGISVDLGGHASTLQLEYHYDIISQEKHHLGLAIGVGSIWGLSFPFGVQYRYGDTHQLETGIYGMVSPFMDDMSDAQAAFHLGYRLNIKRLFFRIYLAPVLDKTGFWPWGGLGLGFYI